MKKLSIYFLLAAIFAMQGFAQTVWNGTASYNWYTTNDGSSPYEIATPEDFAGFSNIVNGTDGQISDHFTGKTVMLTADIYMNANGFESNLGSALQFTPIGNQNATSWNTAPTNYFAGTFNGNYHYIYNVYIKRDIQNPANPATNSDRYYAQAGLFGAVIGTVNMQNVILKNLYLEGSRTIGSIIGYYQGNVTLTNCMSINFTYYTSGTTDWKMSRAAALVGGTDVSSTLTLNNCGATGGNVLPDWAGVLVGQPLGTSNIENCYGYGTFHEARMGGYDNIGYTRNWSNNYIGEETNFTLTGSPITQGTTYWGYATAQTNMQNNATFVTQLGAGWRMDVDGVNNGFPVPLLLDADCLPVTGLHATSNTNSTIGIEWTAPAPAPSSYNVIWGTAGFLPANGELDQYYVGSGTTSNSSYSLTGLDDATSYVIAIQSDCGGGMLSPWIVITSGTTAAESYGAGIWHGYVYAQTNNTSKTFGDYLGYVEEQAQFSRNYSSQNNAWTGENPAWIATAPSDYFSVRYKMSYNFPCGDYIFTINADDHWRLSLDGGLTWLPSHNGATQSGADYWTTACCAAWQTDAVSLNGSYDMVLEFTEGSGGAYLVINWAEVPVSITSLAGPYSAELTFSNGTNWNIKVSTTALADPANDVAGFLTANTSNNPYTLTGLNPETPYYVYALPTDCGTAWGSHNFTTPVLCAQPSNISASNIGSVSADITWNAPLNAASFNIEWGPQGSFTPGSNAPNSAVASTNSYSISSGLAAATAYTVAIQSVCGETEGNSLWTSYDFTTERCEIVDQCAYTLTLGGGDYSWYNGGSVTVKQNGITVYTYSHSGYSGVNITVPLLLCKNLETTVAFSASGYTWYGEASLTIKDNDNNTVVTSTNGAYNGAFTVAEDCSACFPPTATASNIAETSFDVNIAAGVTYWDLKVSSTPINPINDPGNKLDVAEISATSYSVTGLTGSTIYYIYVREHNACWSGAYLFSTESYGDGIWHGYVYAQTNNTSKTFGNYLGYVEEQAQFQRNYTSQNDAWSGENAVWLSAAPADNFSARYKMTYNFTGNNYIFHIGADDYFRLSVDGGQTWLPFARDDNNTWTTAANNYWTTDCCTPFHSNTIEINGSNNLVLEMTEGGGGAYLNFSFENVDCPVPTAITATEIGATEAEISWTGSSSATNYTMEVCASGVDQGNGTVYANITSPAPISNLTPNTNYTVYIRSNCSSSQSSYVNYTFRTACESVPGSQIGFTEATGWTGTAVLSTAEAGTFNGLQAGDCNGTAPDCWTVNAGCIYGSSGNNYPRIEMGDNNRYVIMPPLASDVAMANLKMKVWLRSDNASQGLKIFATDGNNLTGIEVLTTVEGGQGSSFSSGEPHVMREVDLGALYNVLGATGTRIGFTPSGSHRVDIYKVVIWQETPPTCPAPGAITITDVTHNSATVGWTAGGTETEWAVQYRVQGESSWIPVSPNPTTNSCDLTGLSATTTYDVQVMAICTPSTDESVWTPTVNFTTPCVPFAIPHTELFNSSTPAFPTCWSAYRDNVFSTTGTTTNAFMANSSSGCNGRSLRFYANYADAILISPPLEVDAKLLKVTYCSRRESNAAPVGAVSVGYLADLNDPTSFVALQTYSTNTDYPAEYAGYTFTVNLSSVPAGINHVAFKHATNGTQSSAGWIWLDDITFDYAPCTDPADVTVSAITQTTATVSWAASATALSYEVEYKTTAASDWSEPITVTAPAVSTGLTGLTTETEYNVRVKSICTTEESDYTTATPFTTLAPPCDEPTDVTVSDITATTATVSWTASATAASYAVEYKPTASSDWSAPIAVTDLAVSTELTGLTAATEYNVRVKSICATNESSYATATPFTTLICDPADQCNYTLTMYNGGYGWASDWGSTQIVIKQNGIVVFTSPVIPGEDGAMTPVTHTIAMCKNAASSIEHINGSFFYGENIYCQWQLKDLLGNIVAEKVTSGSTAITPSPNFTAACPTCLPVTNVTATNITATSAEIGWTSDGTNFEIEYKPQSVASWTDPAVVADVATASPYSMLSLEASTYYNVRIRKICVPGGLVENEDFSTWTTYTFATACGDVPNSQIGFTEATGWTGTAVLPTAEAGTFNGLQGSDCSGTAPNCWTVNVHCLYGTSGGNYPRAELNNNTHYMIMPPLASDVEMANLKMKIWIRSDNAGQSLKIFTTSGADLTGIELLTTVEGGQSSSFSSGEPHVMREVDLGALYSTLGATGTRIGFTPSSNRVDIYKVVIWQEAPPTCPAPTAITVTNVTDNSATVGWTAGGSEAEWAVQYRVQGESSWIPVSPNPTTTSCDLTGLSATTTYDVQVMAICTPSTDESVWTPTVNFTTPCVPFAIPFLESITSTISNDFPDCWSGYINGNYISKGTHLGYIARSSTPHGIGYTLRLYGSYNEGILITPSFTVDANKLTLNYSSQRAPSTAGYLTVGYLTDLSDASTFVPIATGDYADQYIWYEFNVDLSSIPAGIKHVAFKHVTNGASGSDAYMWLDEIGLNYAPCEDPADVTVSDITATTATVSWAGTVTAVSYEVEYKPTASSDWSEPITVTAPAVSTELTGLTASTEYNVRVKSICTTEESDYTTATPFTTLAPPCEEPADATVSDITATTATVSWTGTATAVSYEVEYKPTASSDWSAPIAVTAPAVSTELTGLTANTEYDVRVKSICATNESGYATATPFTTLICDPADQCTFTFKGTDAYGDGWTNGVIRIKQAGIQVGADITADGYGTADIPVLLCKNVLTEVVFTSGNFPEDVGWTLKDIAGTTVAQVAEGSYSSGTHTTTFTPACPTCLPVTAVTATNITATSAEIGWTSDGANFEIEYKPQSVASWTDPAVVADVAIGSPYSMLSLEPSTYYNVRIRKICVPGGLVENEDFSTWTTYTFATACGDVPNSQIGFTEATGWTGTAVLPTAEAGSFNGLQSTTGDCAGTVPNCWTVNAGCVYGASGSNYPRIEMGDNNRYVIMPPLASDVEMANLKMKVWLRSDNAAQGLKIFTTSGADLTGIELLTTVEGGQGSSFPGGTPHVMREVDLGTFYSTLGATGTRIGFTPSGGHRVDIYKIVVWQEVPPTCPAPTAITVTNVTDNSATVGWTAGGSETEWAVQYRAQGELSWIPVTPNPTTTSCDLTSLSASTTYDVQIMAICDPGVDESVWTATVNFTTLCAPIAISHTESFSNNASNWFPDCWYAFKDGAYITAGANANFMAGSSTGKTGRGLRLYANYNEGILVSPTFDVDVNNLTVNYWSQRGNSTASTMTVGYLTDPSDASSFVAVETFTSVDDYPAVYTFYEFNVDLSSIPAGTKHVAFKHATNGTQGEPGWYWLDEVTFDYTPSPCDEPADVTVSAITQTTATVSWTASATAVSYEVEYKTTASSDWSEPITVTAPAVSTGLTGLAAETEYEVRVKSICATNESGYATASPFTTLATPCDEPTDVTVSAITQTTATVSWTASATAVSYSVEYKPTASSIWSTPITVTAPAVSVNLIGLLCGTSYDVRVKSHCNPDGSSAYVSTTFTTLDCPVCDAPTEVSHSAVTQTTATITWTPGGSETEWQVAWKESADDNWNYEGATAIPHTISNLDVATDYDVKVRAICAVEDSSVWSGVATFATASCDAPTNLVIQDSTEHTITVAWQPMNGETEWKIFYRMPGETAAQIGPITTNPYTITELSDSTTYEICIVAVCAPGVESAPACINATTDRVGIHNLTLSNSLQLYPNPTTGELRITNYELREGDKIEVYNILGQTQPFSILNPQQITIDVSHLSAGIYTVKIGGYVGKFVKR